MMYKIVAVTGLKRSGKDIVSEYISKRYGYNHVKISSKLKSIIKLTFDLTDEDVESNKKDLVNERLNVSPRRLMDFFGTHIFQYEINKIMPNVGRKFWINDLLENNTEPIVISDLRFFHEVDELKKKSSCLILRVNRECIRQDVNFVSEEEIKDLLVDYELHNNSSISNLYLQVDQILNKEFNQKI